MNHINELIVLKDTLVLSKDGHDDIKYDEGTLLKVLLVLNDHIVVKSDNERTFVLDMDDEQTLWTYM
ncbi:MAG: hypothetical protein VX875_03515 [Pseudomonadota bacterium]|jgi:hypothetical protein|nr:hypothetical protein [Pseudomonadota bacterium]